MYYDRKVKYLDYCENGTRIKGCGVVKVQVRDNCLAMEIMLNGLLPTDSFQKSVQICTDSGEDEIGKINIENGKGIFRFQCEDMTQLHKPEVYEKWMGIRILLDENREIRGIWRDSRGQRAEVTAESVARVFESSEEQDMMQTWQQGAKRSTTWAAEQETEQVVAQAREQGAEQSAAWAAEQKTEQSMAQALRQMVVRGTERTTAQEADRVTDQPTEQNAEAGYVGYIEEAGTRHNSKGKTEKQMARALAEDKWEQLWAIYPHITPFGDKREYLSISPADFVIFSADSYKVVNNSFLLHGFYNYHHLILTQMEKKGEKIYYVGVPGNYFEREKQVAIMFGFESFECEEEPAQAGDFGYYMMRAQL